MRKIYKAVVTKRRYINGKLIIGAQKDGSRKEYFSN